MIERVEERFDVKPKRLIGDTACGTAPLPERVNRFLCNQLRRKNSYTTSSNVGLRKTRNDYRMSFCTRWRRVAFPVGGGKKFI